MSNITAQASARGLFVFEPNQPVKDHYAGFSDVPSVVPILGLLDFRSVGGEIQPDRRGD